LEHFPQATWEPWKERRGRGDICGVVTIDGVKIGIEGQGDVADNLKVSLEKFNDEGCEILVCTDRTKRLNGPDPVEVMGTEYGYEIRWKPKQRSAPARRQANDEAVAREIVNEIAAALELTAV